jgi:hypothetical protein
MKYKILILTNIFLLVLCSLFFYLWIDFALRFSDLSSSLENELNRSKTLINFFEDDWKCLSKEALEKKMESTISKNPEQMYFVKKDENDVIGFKNISFQIKDGKVSQIY